MDELTLLAAGACAALAVLVYLMWKSATKPEWQSLTANEKKEWRMKEETRKEKKETPSQAAIGMLGAIYNRLPLIPFLDRQTSAIAYACIAAYLAILLFSFLSTPPATVQMQLRELPLQKNSGLRLLAGESYAYELSSPGIPGASQRVVYDVASYAGCRGLAVAEKSQAGAYSVCLLPSGNAQNDPEVLNSSTGNLTLLLFAPWMLAASENFTWGTQTTLSSYGVDMGFTTSFLSTGEKAVAGRKAFQIRVASEFSSQPGSATYYIDEDKRVLLLAEAGNLSIKLVSAPFALNWSEGIQ